MARMSFPATRATTGLKNCSASVLPGCNPDCPYATRSRKLLSHPICGKNGSSDSTHDAPTFG